MENTQKKSLFRGRQSGIVTRIITVMLVVFVPICALLLITVATVVSRSTDRVLDSLQSELNLQMEQLTEGVDTVEDEMYEFVSDFLTDLNGRRTAIAQITDYDMLRSLDGILEKTELPGYVYLFNIYSRRIYVKYNGLPYSVSDQEDWIQAVKAKALRQETTEVVLCTLRGTDYILISYVYSNYHIGFLLNLPESITDLLEGLFDEGDVYYLSDEPMLLTGDGGTTETDRSWEELTQNNWNSRSISYTSADGLVQVCVRVQSMMMASRISYLNWILFIGVAGCMLLGPLLWSVLKKEIILPLEQLVYSMQKLGEGDLSWRLNDHAERHSREIQFLFDSFDQMAEEVEQSKEKDIKMVKAELDNLRLQVNPHMLLNSYNMIYSLAQTKNYACIQEYTLHLVDYFRYVLRKNDDFVPLKNELNFIESYIEIQKIRFPNAFSWVYHVEEECMEALIPPLLIENFVENSMKYALIPGKKIEILLNVRQNPESGDLVISVCDTGKGIREEILEKLREGEPYVDAMGNKHIGIWNCMRRVEVFYGEKADLNIVSAFEAGTQIFLTIPYREEAKKDESADCG